MIRDSLGRSGGRVIFGLILLFVGGYYFLRNTLGFDLGELDEEAVWPVIVLVLGALILARGLARRPGAPTL
jgi:hypothetical protein